MVTSRPHRKWSFYRTSLKLPGTPLVLTIVGLCVYLWPVIGFAADALPGPGFESSRYESLCKNSPFVVATTDASNDGPAPYLLTGIAHVDGIDYASVVERQTNMHFLLWKGTPGASSGQAVSLVSVTPGQTAREITAVVERAGQSFVLKIENAPNVVVAPEYLVDLNPAHNQVNRFRHLIIPLPHRIETP